MRRRLLFSSVVVGAGLAVLQVWLGSMKPAIEAASTPLRVTGEPQSAGTRSGSRTSPKREHRLRAPADLQEAAQPRLPISEVASESRGTTEIDKGGSPARRTGTQLTSPQLIAAIQTVLVRAGCLARKSNSWDVKARTALATALTRVNARIQVTAPEPAHLALLTGDVRIMCKGEQEVSPGDIGMSVPQSGVPTTRSDRTRPRGIMGLGLEAPRHNEISKSDRGTNPRSHTLRHQRPRRAQRDPLHEQTLIEERLRHPLGRW